MLNIIRAFKEEHGPAVMDENQTITDRAKRLRRNLLVILMLITLIPLCVTTVLSYYQYHRLLKLETGNSARWSAENASLAIGAFLERLQAAIFVVTDAYSINELKNPATINLIFNDLKSKHRGIVDLSLIGPGGIQHSYAGPYNLTGKNYSDSDWYNKALTREIFVSEVFLGFRNLPHFVVAAGTRNPEDNSYWVLRASIGIDILDRFLASVSDETIDDIFLISKEGALQSSSRFRDRNVDKIILKMPPKLRGVTLTDEVRDGQQLVRGINFIEGTPWILVQDRKAYMSKQSWITFRSQLMLIVFICLVIVWTTAFKISGDISEGLKKSDLNREMLLHETEHTNKLASIGRLAAGVAHEINNPLAIINEKAGLMKDLIGISESFPHKERFLTQLSSLENAVSRAKVITHRLLGFARRMEAKLESIDVSYVIEEVVGFLEKEATYRNITIATEIEENLPHIWSDHGQLQQIFLNILNNALEAIDREGKITVYCARENEKELNIKIADNGPGIPQDTVKNIFEPFFTTKRSKNKMGTGLGLSITYGLVTKLGGSITVQSTPGSGTVFSLIFPISLSSEKV